MASPPLPDTDRLTLTPVTADNWRDVNELEVTEAQRTFVAAPTFYLALCFYDGEWQPLAVCLGDRVIGFVMWAVDPADGSCWVGGLIIDKRYQRQGHGRRTLQTLMDLLAAEHGHRRFALSYGPDNPAAHLYHSLGFRDTGEREGGEVVARLWLPDRDAMRSGLGRIWGSRLRTLTWNLRVATPPDVTWARFLSELWVGGAGFGPRPVVEEPGDACGNGSTRRIGVGPRAVREGIVATEYPQRLEYRVSNPSWATFPVDHHVGTVAFARIEDGGTEVRWRVELVPKRGAGLAVVPATRYVIGRYLNALTRACGQAAAATVADPRDRRGS
ncbi:MAG: GNAT family N-acetyltransferase [Trueperaceae bacterium]